MKFFNLDLHVSVISDVATSFEQLGHTVDENCMSGHWWALSKPRGHRGTSPGPNGCVGYGPVNLSTWESMFWLPPLPDGTTAITKMMAAQCPELRNYDGFICCYPPSFVYVYGDLGKPVIMNAPIRYEFPFQQQPEHWRRFNDYLVKGQDSGMIHPVGNSVYECQYYEYFTGRPMTHISSLCEYIDRFSPKWSGGRNVFWSFGEHTGSREAANRVKGVQFIRDAIPQYQHADIPQAKGVVWIPYNCSVMSFFEHYWLNIPIFVPTPRLLLELYHAKMALSQFSWNYDHTGSLLPRVGTSLPDPNHKDSVPQWLDFYDFYNLTEFPYISYFDSWPDLQNLMDGTDLQKTSSLMAAHNQVRKQRVLAQWTGITTQIAVKNKA